MTKDDICKWMHMAWNFSSEENLKRKFDYYEGDYLPYEKFARLVAEHEREACALICENMERNGAWITKQEAAAAIRERRIDGAKVGEVGVWGEK